MKPHSLEQLVAMLHPYVYHVAMGRVARKKVRFGVTHWLTLDGRMLRPDQMTNEHMLNVVRMTANGKAVTKHLISRSLDALAYAATAPDGAADAATEAAEEMMRADFEYRVRVVMEHSPVVNAMVELLTRRGWDPFHDHGPQPLSDYELQRPPRSVRRGRGPHFGMRLVPVPQAIENNTSSDIDYEAIGT